MLNICSHTVSTESVPCEIPAWRPKFSSQGRKERNCGVHCVAMVTHLPVSVISEQVRKFKGTSAEDVALMLYWFGVTSDRKLTRYVDGMRLPQLCILHVQNHWCLYFDPSNSGYGMIYDSCIGIFPRSEDKRRIKNYLKIEIPK